MTELEKAARQALEALEVATTPLAKDRQEVLRARAAIREALAEQPAQQEPVAWMYQCSADSSGPVLMQHKKDWAESGSGLWTETPLYTSPQPSKSRSDVKPWVGLTDEDKQIAFDDTQEGGGFWEFADAIEAKLREKNTQQQSKGDA